MIEPRWWRSFNLKKPVVQIHNNKTIKTSARAADLLATIQSKNPMNIILVYTLICSKLQGMYLPYFNYLRGQDDDYVMMKVHKTLL